MLGGNVVTAYRQLAEPQSAAHLAAALGKSPSSVSKIVRTLTEQGLATRAKGKNSPITRAQTPHATALTGLLHQYPRIPWENLLSHAGLTILAWMTTRRSTDNPNRPHPAGPLAAFEHKPRTPRQLAAATGLQRAYIQRRLLRMATAGVIIRAENGYALNAQHRTLREFIEQYWNHQNHRTQQRDTPEGRILWQRGPEFLLQTTRPPPLSTYQPTGTTIMARTGMPLTTRATLLYHTTRDLTPAEHIIHTFLAAPTTSSHVAYACLHYAKTKPRDLAPMADLYDVSAPMRLLIDYVETRGHIHAPPMPTWADFAELADQYGVNV